VKFLPAVLVACALTFSAGAAGLRVPAAAQAPADDGVRAFLEQLEQVVQSGLTSRYMILVSDAADHINARGFADAEIMPNATRVVIQERDRQVLAARAPEAAYRLTVDAFIEFGDRAREVTWRLDIVRGAQPTAAWRIEDQRRLSGIENLFRLSLSRAKQFAAHGLTIAAEDLDISLESGIVFVSEADQGVTGLVLIGDTQVRFHPAPETEQTQLKIYSGSRTLEAHAGAVFIRINPDDFDTRIKKGQLTPRSADASAFARAETIFRGDSPKSFGLDLGDLSGETWSLVPPRGDFLAEMHTRRYGTLTYARSGAEPEDITLFDRRLRRNIALYSSTQKIGRRGRFFDEDDTVDYDVLDYNIDLAVYPDRAWLNGRALVHLKIRQASASITLRLADSLTVLSVVSDHFGRLFSIRVRNQQSIVVNLPEMVGPGDELTLAIAYAGRLAPEPPDRETVGVPDRQGLPDEGPVIPPEPSYLYTNSSYWYPQSTVTDYATGTLRLTIPAQYECVASGEPAPGSPALVTGADATAQKTFAFSTTQPLRYLAFLISRFTSRTVESVSLPGRTLAVAVVANRREARYGRETGARAADIIRFYTSLLGEYPYGGFTVALVESERPGGHSPGYFAALNQPITQMLAPPRNDPEVFVNYPEFYLAHEVAHQWWGQAVGWRNYHERWISEGFAQYFSALYAQHHRGNQIFAGVMRQLRQWGLSASPQGPIYLGYRLGHIRGDSKVFSALVYNKSAAVLHMLRRLVGDDAFFKGVRRFYESSRYRKAGTEDFRRAMETESHRSLERFFERWIYGDALPTVRFSHRVDGNDVVLHVEQIGELFDFPLTVELQYAGKPDVEVTVPVTERTVEMRVPLDGTLRGVDVSKDDGTLANVIKR